MRFRVARSKFVVARNGDVVGRYCPPLRPALLVRCCVVSCAVAGPPLTRFRPQSAAIEKMLAQAPLLQPLLPVGAVAVPPKALPRAASGSASEASDAAAAAAAAPPPTPPATPVETPAIAPVAVSCTSVDAANVPITPTAAAAAAVGA